ncbi:hypothetical protein HY218_02470 [Candidatus Saccharibacteria bacterium]|nr:hypothetical protein [Candidatus Saccharibacteria bacterium]
MNEEQLEDLKQFIGSRISQTEARFDEKVVSLDTKVESLAQALEKLREEMHDGFAGVGEAVDEINKQVDERLTKLEKQAA